MTKTATAKILNSYEAITKVSAIFKQLSMVAICFTIRHNSRAKWFQFVSLIDADTMKHLIPESEIHFDTHKRRYAELFINYE